jgi:hypothetical protein
MNDPTARLSSNTPFPVEDKRLMDQGVANKVELLCHIRKTPQVLYGMFLDLTRQLYVSSDNLPIDVCATWDPDPNKSHLWIGTEYEWEEQAPEFRPAIYIKLGELTYKSITGRDDSLMGVDLEEGEYQFSRNGNGTVSWVHVGSTKGEAVALCGTTLDYMDAFSRVIRDDLKFQTFELTSVMPAQPDKESRDRWRSVVTMSFSFEDTWALKLESPKLKRVIFLARQAMVLHGIV